MRPVGAVAEKASKSPFDDGESTDGRARRELWKGKKANCPQTPREKGTRGAGAAVHRGDRMLRMGGGSRAGRLAQSTVLDGVAVRTCELLLLYPFSCGSSDPS